MDADGAIPQSTLYQALRETNVFGHGTDAHWRHSAVAHHPRRLCHLIKILILVAAVTLVGGPAYADRPPTAEESERIETQLRALGFTSWEEIERDDGHWEVDDAIGPDGGEYELKLHPETLEVVKQERD